eukprot:1745810-Rhodomonas_salina.3
MVKGSSPAALRHWRGRRDGESEGRAWRRQAAWSQWCGTSAPRHRMDVASHSPIRSFLFRQHVNG